MLLKLKLKRRSSASTTRPRRASRPLLVETLEGRALLSLTGVNLPPGATINTGPVAVNGKYFFGANDTTHGYQLWRATVRQGAPRC
jgi:hypothetical protein